MATLRFFFGTMGSGKSTMALQIRHNLTGRGLECLLITQLDRQEGKVSSRLGVSADAMILDHTVDLFRVINTENRTGSGLHAVICDEAQFYEPNQIDQLARVVDELDVEVYAFGLLTTFQGVLFPERNDCSSWPTCGRRSRWRPAAGVAPMQPTTHGW